MTVNINEFMNDLNTFIRDENGNRISENDTIVSSGVDSFGFTMVMLNMDSKYEMFSSDWLKTIDHKSITALDMYNIASGDQNNDSIK